MPASASQINVNEPNPAVLARFFNGPRRPEAAMPLTVLDGFLTAVAASPGLLRPSDWLDEVWGDDGPEFESLDEANAVLGALMARYNEIVRQIGGPPSATDREAFVPCLDPAQDKLAEARLWAEGFLACVGTFDGAWKPLVEAEEGWPLILPFMMLADPDRARELFKNKRKPIPREELEKAFDMIPMVLKTLVMARQTFFLGQEPARKRRRNGPETKKSAAKGSRAGAIGAPDVREKPGRRPRKTGRPGQ